jgi:N-methylhydantoinase B
MVRLEIDSQEKRLPMRSKIEKQVMHPGDWVFAASPGGGGFGNPLERPLDLVQEDLDLGFISVESARSVYGAVVAEANGKAVIDMDASKAQRSSKAA